MHLKFSYFLLKMQNYLHNLSHVSNLFHHCWISVFLSTESSVYLPHFSVSISVTFWHLELFFSNISQLFFSSIYLFIHVYFWQLGISFPYLCLQKRWYRSHANFENLLKYGFWILKSNIFIPAWNNYKKYSQWYFFFLNVTANKISNTQLPKSVKCHLVKQRCVILDQTQAWIKITKAMANEMI